MNELEDELDLKYHRGQKPDVYYRVPSLEALDGALSNELQKNAASLIPIESISEFVFGSGSTITIPPIYQGNIEELGSVPAEFPQIVSVDQALCPDIEDNKVRLKVQRAIARSVLDVIQSIDGFKYTERQATYQGGTDGTRFKYICVDSTQNRDRKVNGLRKSRGEETAEQVGEAQKPNRQNPTFDCGGAVHIKFSKKRDAINIVYKHNPIHRNRNDARSSYPQNGNSEFSMMHDSENFAPESSDGIPKPKRKRRTKAEMEAARAAKAGTAAAGPPNGYQGYQAAQPDMATSPETSRSPTKKRKKHSSNGAPVSPNSAKKQKKSKQPMNDYTSDSVPPPAAEKPKGACLRCREKKIKCNEAQPTCNQCQRGLWTCEYKTPKTRSKSGCFTCRVKKRKCSEEKPSCAYCIRQGESCEYPFAG